MRCPRCDAEQEGQPNFCTTCGHALADAPSPGSTAPPDTLREPATVRAAPPVGAGGPGGATAASATEAVVDARFVACHTCGATNAASRRRCGRCGADLAEDARARDSAASATPLPDGAEGPPEDVPTHAPPPSGSPVVFVIAVTLAGVAILGIILTMLSASGIGPFATPPPEPQENHVTISSVRASSVRDPAGGVTSEPEHLIDGDTTTAWRESASGDGVGEWVELQLEGSPQVSRLVLWNGDQREGMYASSARPAQLRIDLSERTFTADLLDVDGPQAIELPEVIETTSIRLTIAAVRGGQRGVAISQIEVRGPRPEVTDDET